MWAVFMVARYEQKAEIVRQHKSRDAFLVKRRSCSDSGVSRFTNDGLLEPSAGRFFIWHHIIFYIL